jgi:hypothetical protein
MSGTTSRAEDSPPAHPETIRVELPEEEANQLTQLLKDKEIQYAAALSRQMTGEALFVSVILPVTLTAVQVLVAFFLAKKKPDGKPPEARIEVCRRYIKTEQFSAEVVETIVERKLGE